MKRHALATMVAMVHLGLVLCGATCFYLLPKGSQGEQYLRVYGEMSGADNGYWFFAPGVAQQIRVTFVLKDSTGRTWTHEPSMGQNREEYLRVTTLLGSFRRQEASAALAESWAAHVFADFPDAQEAVVNVDMYNVPTMADYAAGARPSWDNLYAITVHRTTEETQEP